ncbi:hypothetical protein BD413DRAFT_582132 [Trametes elegans]|nr:hypothetical protein BD413DRAFT_582132 [Trametes elegans]
MMTTMIMTMPGRSTILFLCLPPALLLTSASALLSESCARACSYSTRPPPGLSLHTYVLMFACVCMCTLAGGGGGAADT